MVFDGTCSGFQLMISFMPLFTASLFMFIFCRKPLRGIVGVNLDTVGYEKITSTGYLLRR